MGHTRTPKFEGQLELKPGQRYMCFGADSIREAISQGKLFRNEECTGKLLVWGNNKAGRDYFERQGKMYLEVAI